MICSYIGSKTVHTSYQTFLPAATNSTPLPLTMYSAPDLYSFTGLADYQYVATAKAGGEACVVPYGAESEPVLLVPSAFSQQDQPVDYAFRDFRASDGRQADGASALGGSLLAAGRLLCYTLSTLRVLCFPLGLPVERSVECRHLRGMQGCHIALQHERFDIHERRPGAASARGHDGRRVGACCS